MPTLGEICSGKKIGKQHCRWIYVACPDCGAQRWAVLHDVLKRGCKGLCKPCVRKRIGLANKNRKWTDEQRKRQSLRSLGNGNPAWKGGRWKTIGGYIEIRLMPDDFFFPMADHQHKVKEHRLVMAKHLGRCLHPWEIVHHINGIKDDNRLENLELLTDIGHKGQTRLEAIIKQQNKRIIELEKENMLLKNSLR